MTINNVFKFLYDWKNKSYKQNCGQRFVEPNVSKHLTLYYSQLF